MGRHRAWDSWTNNGYTLINDVWGSGAGPQTIWARTGTNWGVVANHPRTSGVKSYPHTGKTLNRTLSSLGSLRSSFNVTVPGDGDYSTAYDIWANNNAYEVMIWTNQNGAVGPIAETYDSNGAVPTPATSASAATPGTSTAARTAATRSSRSSGPAPPTPARSTSWRS